ncbi:MAG TPA: hypothetical protein VFD82_03455 [Planctomycetota bacterium]|nr:hypothetical protein [Planctomycetota bacterium]
MKLLLPACLCLAVASLPAQNYLELPATAAPTLELPNYSTLPLMQPNARVQMFYDATEVGSAAFVADRIELRYDGPIPQVGAPGPFTITHLQIRIGTTDVPMPGANFSANLTQPLSTVVDGPWTYLPDSGSGSPHPWGGPGGTLTFPFTSPTPVVVPPGSWFVVDVTMEGNNISQFGFAHAILDGAATTGGIGNGTAATYGQGCSAGTGLPAATVTASGIFAPGGAHFLNGQNLGANAPVIAIYGLSNGSPLPLLLPGTNCTLLASLDVTSLLLADGTGAVTNNPAAALALPADPAISGFILYEQLGSLVVAANPWGIVLGNAVAVNLGTFTNPGRGTYSVAHDTDAAAPFGNTMRAFGYAMRVRTL